MFIEQAWNYWSQDWVGEDTQLCISMKAFRCWWSNGRDKKPTKLLQQEHEVHSVGMVRESTSEVHWRNDSFIAQEGFHEEEGVKMGPFEE